MITCPLCEHQQSEGSECESCGKLFSAVPSTSIDVAPMPGLEVTLIADGRAEVEVAPVPELELNRLRSGPDLPPATLPDLERAHLDVGEVSVAPLPEMELGRAQDDGQRTALPPTAVTCRYCKNVQSSGSICERCGMRLPYRPGPAAAAATPDPKKRVEDVWTRCRSCGAPAKVGHVCGDCGRTVPPVEP